jgi:hypothetical protein
MKNTWPGGNRHAMNQDDHEKWNYSNYPGTRQICSVCEAPTGFCEEDGYLDEKTGEPLCQDCFYQKYPTNTGE